MTDSSEADRELDAAIARLVIDAGSDAPDAPDMSTLTVTELTGSRYDVTRRRVTVAAIGSLAAAAAVLAFVAIDVDDTDTLRPAETAPTPTDPLPTIVAETSEPTIASTVAETSEPTIASTVTAAVPTTSGGAPPPAGITRPVVAADVCEPISAREGISQGVPTLFARGSNNPIPIQIIGDPTDGPTGAFALVQRFFGDDYRAIGQEVVDIDGTEAHVTVYDNGNGQVIWDLADGSQGHLRSRGLDRDELVEIVAGLTPRADTDPIPGFDYTAVQETTIQLELLHEQINTDVRGEVAGFECRVVATDYVYRISALGGDPVYQYAGVIDRPTPLEVGVRSSTVIVVNGLADPTAPTVDDVVDADPTAWLDLRSRLGRLAEGGPLVSVISEGGDVVVALTPIDDTSTVTSYLTLRLTTEQDVTFLQVDTTNAVLAPDAAFWRTEIGGRVRGISTARTGSVMGFRIGETPITDPIDVKISIIDGGDFVLQSTEPIQLSPQP
ncbi:MAG TPA: hypothetical protein VNO51_23325 [Ilumatobacteraceae bacterium]|nr:hypothetical protein [Ilumatobacteraceae bacterium]